MASYFGNFPWLFTALALWFIAALVLLAQPYIHILQLESYQVGGYFRRYKRYFAAELLIIFVGLLLAPLLDFVVPGIFVKVVSSYVTINKPVFSFSMWERWAAIFPITLMMGSLPTAVVIHIIRRRSPQKKPLKYTARAKRLHVSLILMEAFLLSLLGIAGNTYIALVGSIAVLYGTVGLAACAIKPVESLNNRRYFNDAKRRLAKRPDLMKIGITGSFGKTSVKFILAAILSEKYNVLATPSSFNTPMGLTRVIREQLTDEHQVFLAEMGARHVGDIAELCELVRPTVGVLTSIGPQHLETFYTIERVAKTKFELIDRLPSGGKAVLAGTVARDWPELVSRRSDIERTTAGMLENCDARAFDIEVGPEGSEFSLKLPGEKTMRVHTKLLGAHNIDNVALCCAVAHRIGLTAEEIARGAAKAEPVEHRLQLIRGAGGNLLIDDAFNSNPAGAKAALDVLAAFPGRKIIVTPGMVELGEREQELNRAFGEQIVDAADIAILIGRTRSKPIADGLRSRGFPGENLHIAASLDEATAILARIARQGDVTLFENDLPDNYEE